MLLSSHCVICDYLIVTDCSPPRRPQNYTNSVISWAQKLPSITQLQSFDWSRTSTGCILYSRDRDRPSRSACRWPLSKERGSLTISRTFFHFPVDRETRKYGGRGFIPRCAPVAAAAAAAAAPPSLVFHPLGKNKGTNAAAHNRRNIFDARSRARERSTGGWG